jgi:hypothetical protein
MNKGNEFDMEVAERFRNTGDHTAEVRQLRNSAFVSLFAHDHYSMPLCERIADACGRVALDSLAAKTARAYGQHPAKA